MNKALLTIWVFYLLTLSCNAQKNHNFKIERVFLEKDTSRNCYTILYPPKPPIKGYVFLLPGFSESAQRVLQQSSLPQQFAKNGLLTIIPTLHDGVFSFGIDAQSQLSFQKIIEDVRQKNTLNGLPFYLGGIL